MSAVGGISGPSSNPNLKGSNAGYLSKVRWLENAASVQMGLNSTQNDI
jgi:hypothetical protein